MISNFDTHNDDLIRIGALNLEDLEVNRAGRLSERQRRMLYGDLVFWAALASLEIIILAVLAYFQVFILRNGTFVILEVALLIGLLYLCIKSIEPVWKDLKADKPKSITGRLVKRFSRVSGNGKGSMIGYCTIRVDDQVFSVSPAIYDCVVNEESYRVYYVRNTRKVINIEPQ